jgi:hypothetical protein
MATRPEIVSPNDLDLIVGDETYHLRNPLYPAQPRRAHKQYDESEKEILKVRLQTQKQKSATLRADIEELWAETESKVHNLSLKYSEKENVIRDQILNISSFKPQRKTSLFNAEVSMRAKELRESE